VTGTGPSAVDEQVALVESRIDTAEVLYIGAVGRSGSTLLERLLGVASRPVPLGELVHLWDRGVERNEPCSCRLPFRSCPFWSEVGEVAFGGWDQLDPRGVNELRRQVDRTRYLPWLARPSLAPQAWQKARERYLSTLLYPLYSALGQVCGPDAVLIDASKHPSYAYLLRDVEGVRLRVVHLVRDPRGVAWSWQKSVLRPEAAGGGPEQEMERLDTLAAAGRWTSHNLAFELLERLGVPTRLVRYEQLSRNPVATMVEATADLDTPLTGADFAAVTDRTVVLGTDHTVAGNPMRFSTGPLTLREDEVWRGQLPRRDRGVLEALTGPLRLLYDRRSA